MSAHNTTNTTQPCSRKKHSLINSVAIVVSLSDKCTNYQYNPKSQDGLIAIFENQLQKKIVFHLNKTILFLLYIILTFVVDYDGTLRFH